MSKDEVFQMAKAIAEANRHPTPDDYAAAVADAYEVNTAPPVPEPDQPAT